MIVALALFIASISLLIPHDVETHDLSAVAPRDFGMTALQITEVLFNPLRVIEMVATHVAEHPMVGIAYERTCGNAVVGILGGVLRYDRVFVSLRLMSYHEVV